jgi:hypothetical protein
MLSPSFGLFCADRVLHNFAGYDERDGDGKQHCSKWRDVAVDLHEFDENIDEQGGDRHIDDLRQGKQQILFERRFDFIRNVRVQEKRDIQRYDKPDEVGEQIRHRKTIMEEQVNGVVSAGVDDAHCDETGEFGVQHIKVHRIPPHC